MESTKSKYYTIGELSKLTNLSIQTLRFYDKINLFKPSYVDSKTNYRYYAESQLYYIDLIRSLKYIGTPLEEIKTAQDFTSTELLEFLKQQEMLVEEKIKRLQDVQYILMKTKKQMEDQLNIPIYNEIYETIEPPKRLLALKAHSINLFWDDPSSHFISLNRIVENEGGIINQRYGGIYPLNNYQNVKEIYYDYVCIPLLSDKYIQNLTTDMNVLTMPEGPFISIAFEFDMENYLVNYQRLYQYIQVNNISTQSPVYEFFTPTKYNPNEEPTFIVELKVKF